MKNLIIQQLEKKQVKLITPQGINDDFIKVARFTDVNVENLVPNERVCGVYLIGSCTPRLNGMSCQLHHEFRVCYFGRSDEDVKQRLHDHLVNGGNQNEQNRYDESHYFAIWSCDNSREAYEREMAFYNEFFKGVNDRRIGYGYSSNQSYSHTYRLTAGRSFKCLPYKVYVDNVNKPAEA